MIPRTKGKADALNQQFESVFTREGPLANDLLPASLYPAAEDIEISVAGVQKLLERLNVHKAAGPDRIGPQVLKNLACVVAPILTVIFRKSYETGCIPDDWDLHMSRQHLRRARIATQLVIAQYP